MIREANSIESLIPNCDDANVFFTHNYRESECLEGHSFVYLYSETYVIPVRITKKLCFKYAFFPTEPFKYNSEHEESVQSFLDQVCDYLTSVIRVDWISENDTASLFPSYPNKSIHIPFGSHVIDLSKGEDDLWGKVHSKHRNVIKKAEKDGVVIEKGVSEKLISDYHELDVDTWKRSNLSAQGKSQLRNRIQALGNNAIIYMAYKDDKPQSGGLFYYNKQMCYYMLGANCDKPYTGSGNLLQWRAILDMKAQGVEKYSFVGCRINEDENSKYHGIQRFKERFGGELVQGYLFKLINRKLKHSIFLLLIAAKSFLHTGHFSFPKDVIDQELYKWQ